MMIAIAAASVATSKRTYFLLDVALGVSHVHVEGKKK